MPCIQSRIVRDVVALDESATCSDAARLMAERRIGSVAVRRGAKLVGLVTKRDLASAVTGGVDPSRTPLGMAMRADAPAVSVRATDRECAQLMRKRGTRHVAVKDGEEIVGVISLRDLADLALEEKQWNIDELETNIRGCRACQLRQGLGAASWAGASVHALSSGALIERSSKVEARGRMPPSRRRPHARAEA